jgi:hypothetical protein
MHPMINLPLTIEEAGHLIAALYSQELKISTENNSDWYTKRIAQALTNVRRELKVRQSEARALRDAGGV